MAGKTSMELMNANVDPRDFTRDWGLPLSLGESDKGIPHPSASPANHGAGLTRLLVCFALLWGGIAQRAIASEDTKSYSTVVSEHLALENQSPLDASNSEEGKTEDPRIADLKRAVATKAETLPQGRRVAIPQGAKELYILPALAVPIGTLLIFGLVVHQLRRRYNALFPTFQRSEEFSKSVVLQDPSIAAFFHELRDGLKGTGEGEAVAEAEAPVSATEAVPVAEELFSMLHKQIVLLRSQCLEFVQATEETNRQKLLAELIEQAATLKKVLRPTDLRPAWLVTCAVVGLLRQVSKNVSELSESVTKTLTDALDLLGSLSVPGINPNLASERPVRLLAVDDDAVSRLAVAFALRQAFEKPDIANDGAMALTMIAQQTYDVIFLDVDMPTMDGFQLCKQIHQTESHRNTPVVFVTGHNDYNTRAMSKLSGGESHIAKPFLSFEITVKALTLVLRSRLGIEAQPETVEQPVPLPDAIPATPAPPLVESKPAAMESEGNSEKADLPQMAVSTQADEFISSALMQAAGENSPDAFTKHSPAYVAALRNQLLFAREARELPDQQKFLTRLLMGLGLLKGEADRVERRMVAKMCNTLERMLNKVLEQNELCTHSTLSATALALDLIEELSIRTGADIDLTSQPISILVVDDDPVSRRALSMAIQMAFGRPEQAENGEVALDLAEKKAFDLIFLDVLMPGMDGFTSCVKIHETPRNQQTPAVFVTGKNDDQSVSQAMVSGGAAFITKPVVPSQITLTAMTFVLRNRLTAFASAQAK